MRVILAFLTTLALASAALLPRNLAGAKAAFNTLAGSQTDAALVANTNTFLANLNGVAPLDEIKRAESQVARQIQANHQNRVPTKQTAAWVASVLNHFLQ